MDKKGEDVLRYIKERRQKGHADVDIEKSLRAAGHLEHHIKEYFEKLEKEVSEFKDVLNEDISNYIRQRRKKGHSDADIKEGLRGAGHLRHHIEGHFEMLKEDIEELEEELGEDVLAFIAQSRKNGQSAEEIKKILRGAGHKEHYVGKHFEKLMKKSPVSPLLIVLLLVGILLVGVVSWTLYQRSLQPAPVIDDEYLESLPTYYSIMNSLEDQPEGDHIGGQVEQLLPEGCTAWEKCHSDLISKYVFLKLSTGSTPSEILADQDLREELLTRKEKISTWMSDYLSSGDITLFQGDFNTVRFILEALNNLDLLSDGEREQWILDLARIEQPPTRVNIRIGSNMRFLGSRLGYSSFEDFRDLPGFSYETTYASLCESINMEEIEPFSGYMLSYLKLREFCDRPLTPEEVALLTEVLDTDWTDEKGAYLKREFLKLID